MHSYRLAFTDSVLSAFRPRGAPARWNSEGTVMVYTSEHIALSALEILTGWEAYPSLQGYHLYRATFAETHIVEAPESLDVHNKTLTRDFGDTWIREGQSLALKVPSVVAPYSFNYLLNPAHPDFYNEVRLEPLGPFIFDKRIEGLTEAAKQV